MKGRPRVVGVAAALVLAGCHRGGAGKKIGDNPMERESYSLGYQLGTNLKKQQMPIDLDAYVHGLREGIVGAESQVGAEELRTALIDLRNKAVAAQKTGLKEKGEKNHSEGQAFLEDNKHREGVRVMPSGLQYKVLNDASSGGSPKPTDTVVVNYRGTLVDGTEFANTYKQKKAVVISLTRVIPAWREALPLMKEGSKWQLFVPPALGYGARGGPGIEPDSTLIFEVELLGFRSGQPTRTSALVQK